MVYLIDTSAFVQIWLGALQATSRYLNEWWFIPLQICVPLRLIELNNFSEWKHLDDEEKQSINFVYSLNNAKSAVAELMVRWWF